MKHNRIGNRILAMLLAAVLILSMLPAMNTSAVPIDADGYLGNVKLLNNGESISLPIKVNNFALDGMMFEYLSDNNAGRDSQFFVYEKDCFYQLLPLHLAGKAVGVTKNGDVNDKNDWADPDVAPDSDGLSAGVDEQHSLHGTHGEGNDNYKGVTSGGKEYFATLAPSEKTDGGGTKYLQLRQYDRDEYGASGRTWRKLTRFTSPITMNKSRYAVIIYRVNGDTYYDNMLLTWDYYDEITSGAKSNCSQTVKVAKNTSKAANAQWQYAIIDLAYKLGDTEEERAAAAATKTIQDIYLKSPLNYFRDGYNTTHKFDNVTYPATGNSMDLAAVAYFPYYGDAEQFAHYGLSMGCISDYYGRDNEAFNFNSAADGYTDNNYSVVQWARNEFGQQIFVNAENSASFTLQADGTTDADTINTVEKLGYALFGNTTGSLSLGLMETQLGENGRPVYRESVVSFVAYFLQRQLTAVEEYPVKGNNNYGWKNASFITGVSTTSGVDEALFGKDELGHSMDLATALCKCVDQAVKGGGTYTGTMGTYAETRAKARDLTGTWNECKGNIDTWFDAAYFLLHNLFVTNDDKAYDGDGYGEYENNYHNLVLPQVSLRNYGDITTGYCFDAGFAKNGITTNSAVIYDPENGLIDMDPSANLTGGTRPFLPTSGNGTEYGESNSPYYIDPYAIKRDGGYQKRDYHFTISGNGMFPFERDLFFEFRGDDDVYLFINGQLVLDIGGTHAATTSKIYLDHYVDWAWSVKKGESQYKGLDYNHLPEADRNRIDALALEEGGVYSFDFFYMERHGAGSNLRIVTNMQVTGEGLNVEKSAYQNGIEIAKNGIVNVNLPVEYGFKITNDSLKALESLTFCDSVIGVSIDPVNGLVIAEDTAPYIKNASGNPLTVADLEIQVSGNDGSNVTVTCYSNDELKAFMENLTSNDGTVSGEGLWSKASVLIKGIYYTMTDAQKAIGSFRNYVTATADAGDIILRGADDHTVYQPGKLAYYQWVGKPVVILREQLYQDLLSGIVSDAAQLPELGNMILIPSDANGIECQDNGLVNSRGGDVFLQINYTVPRTYIAYVTIRDRTDPNYRMTVPVTIYATDTKDTAMVLDYGLDSYLTDQGAIFDHELDLAVGEKVTGTVMGVADRNVDPSYLIYHTDSFETAAGNTANHLTQLYGTYSSGQFSNARLQLNTPIYLEHTKPWVIEFNVGYMQYNDCLLSTELTKMAEDHKERLYLTNTGIGLGYSDGTAERFYGVAFNQFRESKMTTVKLFNVPAGDGSNMVYCSINGGSATAMNTVFVDRVNQNRTDSAWISGRDFTFAYMGCNGHGLYLKMDYLRVYEQGKPLAHHHWVSNENQLVAQSTGKPGYVNNAATDSSFTLNNVIRNRWTLSEQAVLNHDRAWEIEFRMRITATTNNFMLLSSTESKQNDKTTYVYFVPSKRFISMGSNVDGTYINYGTVLPERFDMALSHTYLLKNRIAPNGTNTVYLYVKQDVNEDWTEVGPLNYYSVGSSIGTISNGLSGKDFSFSYIGGFGGFAFTTQEISYVEIREDTALRSSYEWKAETEQFASCCPTGDGNRIIFPSAENGIVEDDSGTFTLTGEKLKFETSDFMDQAYTAYVAFTIHDKTHTPTAVNRPGVDVSKEVQMFKKVSVIPANVVYYEDDFPAIHYTRENENVFTVIGSGTSDLLQSADQDREYGSDPFYSNQTSHTSGDHITKITINEDDSNVAWFELKGTGFELISRTDAKDPAMIYIQVFNKADVTIDGNKLTVIKDEKQDANGTTVQVSRSPLAWIPLNPEFDHNNDGGEEVIHQVPIIRWQRQDDEATETVDESLIPGDYVVMINAYASYDFDFSMMGQEGYKPPMLETSMYIDGIRIFQPLGYEHDGYTTVENRVLFEEIRDHILDGNAMVCQKNDVGIITISSGMVTWTENYGPNNQGTHEFKGTKVDNVNDYLLRGPNNEVYMAYMKGTSETDASATGNCLAFVVSRNAAETFHSGDLELQLGVRAIDAGDFYGNGSSGLNAKLELGVTDSKGVNSWMPLASVNSGTEQYISIPYELCPAIVTETTVEYNVVIRVSAFTEGVPAMVSFSSIKRSEGLKLKQGITEAVSIKKGEDGQWTTSQGEHPAVANFMMVRNAVMTQRMISYQDAVRGENFVQVDPIPEHQPAIVPKYPALSFEEEVQYHVFFTLQNFENVALNNMGLITFDTENTNGTVADAMDVIPGALLIDDEYVVHTNGIPAKKLGDMLYFKVYAKCDDGSYVYSRLYHYSAKTYAMNQLSGINEAVKPLAVAMLNYGAAAQQFFGYKTDTMMNADLTADQQALVQNYDPSMAAPVGSVDAKKAGMFVNNGGFIRKRPSVTFGGAFSINYFFTPAYEPDEEITLYFWDEATCNNAQVLTAQNALCSETMHPGETAEYFAAYEGIAAKRIGDTVYAAAVYESNGNTYCSGVLPYSLSLYCKRFAENDASSAQELAAATMVYGHYAQKYFGS